MTSINYQSYLSEKPDNPNRPKVNVVLYNQFEGYLDWWRDNDEFIKVRITSC